MPQSVPYDVTNKRIFVAGHRGMVGSAIVRRLQSEACTVLTVSRDQVDLRNSDQVATYFKDTQPDCVILAAAKVGGILANSEFPADFIYDNLAIQNAVIHNAYRFKVEKLLCLGSSCIYPKHAPQPITEDSLLSGPLEPTNQAYAVAKIAGIEMCAAYRSQYGCDFISAMPNNLYGPHDNFDLNSSHVIPALMRKAHQAKNVGADHMVIWGSGSPKREFMHVDDCADALIFVFKHYSEHQHINIGLGKDLTIRSLAELICRVVGFEGTIETDLEKPDGTPRKLMSSEKLNALGWRPTIDLEQGLRMTYDWFLQNEATIEQPNVQRA